MFLIIPSIQSPESEKNKTIIILQKISKYEIPKIIFPPFLLFLTLKLHKKYQTHFVSNFITVFPHILSAI